MATQIEPTHALEGVLSEANGDRSREEVVILANEVLPAMSVVGRITASGKYKQVEAGQADGSQTAAGVLLYAVDATGADGKGVIIARDAVLRASALNFEASEDAGEQTAHLATLATLGIITR